MTFSNSSTPLAKLAPRELEVLTLTAQGKTRGEIAKALHVSEETVKAYIERARVKLRAANKTHAVAIAVTLGLFSSSAILRDDVDEKFSKAPQKGTAHDDPSPISLRKKKSPKD